MTPAASGLEPFDGLAVGILRLQPMPGAVPRVTYANATAASYLARPLAALHGRSLAELFEAARPSTVVAALLRVAIDGTAFRERVLLDAASYLVTAARDGSGTIWLSLETEHAAVAADPLAVPVAGVAPFLRCPVYALELQLDGAWRLLWWQGPLEQWCGLELSQLDDWLQLIEPAGRVAWRDRNVRAYVEGDPVCRYTLTGGHGTRVEVFDRALLQRSGDRVLLICGIERTVPSDAVADAAPALAPTEVPETVGPLADAPEPAPPAVEPAPATEGEPPSSEPDPEPKSAPGLGLAENVADSVTPSASRDPDSLPHVMTLGALAAAEGLDPRLPLPDVPGSVSPSEAATAAEPDLHLRLDRRGGILAASGRLQGLANAVQNVADLGREVRDRQALASAIEALREGISPAVVWVRICEGPGGHLVSLEQNGDGFRGSATPWQGPIWSPMESLEERRLRAILDHLVDGLIVCNTDGVIQTISRPTELLFGTPDADLSGRHIEQMLALPPGEAADLLTQIDRAADAQGRLVDCLARNADGSLIPLDLQVRRADLGGEAVYVILARDVSAHREAEETIRRLVSRDPLTGLPNRLLFDDRLNQVVERSKRNPQEFAVMLLDLDRFKLVNESLGMAKGDQLLRAVGERLEAALRRSDTVARLGGDEFLILLPGTRGAESAAKVAQKILDTLRQPYRINGQELSATASLGIAIYPHDGDDGETLVRNADTALYRAKEQGRNGYQFYTTDMNARAFERLVLETQLRRALERDELRLQYQPIISLETGEITAIEALVRWHHPELGHVPPNDFIPLAEETGLITSIGQWVLTQACREVTAWRGTGNPNLRLAVNLSSRQFKQRDLVDSIIRALEITEFPAGNLELELTESALMDDVAESVERLRAIHALGVGFAVDDFGTGYSSLAYLKRFPIRSLKIDRSFVQDLTTDPNDRAIAQAIVALAELLKIQVIAEGVETEDQLHVLKAFGCDEAQGYLISRPIDGSVMATLLASGRDWKDQLERV